METFSKKKTIQNRIKLTVILLLFFLPILLPKISVISEDKNQNSHLEAKSYAAYDFHSIIEISSNAELISFPDKTGSGTFQDPYLITNLEINGGGTESGISISNTNLPLIISYCKITNAGPEGYHAGIKLDNAANISINSCNISNNLKNGILAENSQNLSIQDNTINLNAYM